MDTGGYRGLEEGESSDKTDEGTDNAAGRLDNVDWCNHARAVCRGMSLLLVRCANIWPSAPAIFDQ